MATRIERLARERALEEICLTEAKEFFHKPVWKTALEYMPKIGLAAGFAGVLGGINGLEYAAPNALAMGEVLIPLSLLTLAPLAYLKATNRIDLEDFCKQRLKERSKVMSGESDPNILRTIFVSGCLNLLSLGTITLANKLNLIGDFSSYAILGANAISQTINYVSEIMKNEKFKQKVYKRAEELKETIRQEEELRGAGDAFERAKRDFEEFMRTFINRNGGFRTRQNYEEPQNPPAHKRESMSYTQACTILDITRQTDYQEAKRNYRLKALKLHPDVNKAPGAEAKFKELSKAWEIVDDYHKSRTTESNN